MVLLETPAPLERALRTALMPWGMQVARPQSRARPRPPTNPDQARSLARRLHADALVWLTPALPRHELWLYDGSSGTLTTRSVPRPPFDETRAAALALSVKTELRKGTLADAAPVSDVAAKIVVPAGKEVAPTPPLIDSLAPREATAEASSDTSETAEPATPEAPLPETPLPEAPATEAPLPEPSPPEPSRSEPSAPEPPVPPESSGPIDTAPSWKWSAWRSEEAPSWKLVLHAGARVGATSLGGSEGRYAVEARWAPWADPKALATFWLSARADLGLARPVANENFRGDYSEFEGGLGVGVSLRLSPWFELGIQAGAGLRTTTLSGILVEDGAPGEQTRRGLDLHVRPELELSLGTVGLLVQPALGAAPQRWLFQADKVEVFETNAVWWQLGGGLRVAID